MRQAAKATVAFGSCSKADSYAEQPVWKAIQAAEPTHLVLLGDQIYMDFGMLGLYKPAKWPMERFRDEMHRRYALQWAVPQLREFLAAARLPPDCIFMTWDDHDFAWNNAVGGRVGAEAKKPYGVDAAHRDVSEALAMQYLEALRGHPSEYPSCPTEFQAAGGIHAAGTIAQVPIFVLDTRSFCDHPTGGGSVLGDAQERWLADRLAPLPPEQPVIVASGITLGNGRPLSHQRTALEEFVDHKLAEAEAWNEREEPAALLSRLFADRKALWLSGDIHLNAFVTHELAGSSLPLHEAVSSGLAIRGYKPGWWGEQRNFGLLRLYDDRWEVELHRAGKGRVETHSIDLATWISTRLVPGRE